MTRDDILKLAGELNGTAKSLDDVLEKEYGLDLTEVEDELLELLDQTVQCCEACGWWTDAELINDECLCNECSPKN